MPYFVYILASQKNGTLYIGVTNDLARRLEQHRTGSGGGFTGRYHVHRLVHAESFDEPAAAIQREKSLKHWPRAWKVNLIQEANPEWRDLAKDVP